MCVSVHVYKSKICFIFKALRGASILRTRMQKGCGFALAEEKCEGKESNVLTALNFVSRGGEILKLTRKGVLT